MEKTLASVKAGSSDRFGYEWSIYNEILPQHEEQFLKWMHPLGKEFFKNKTVLDAGCGTGRNSYWALKYGAKKVDAFDYDERTVEVARRNLNNFPNTRVFRKSIYDLDARNIYDLAFSIGVIHHLEYPVKAIQKLFDSVRPGGKLLIWVYGREGNEWLVKYINPIRKITSRLPAGLMNILAGFFSIPLCLFLKVKKHNHPYFKQLSRFNFLHVHAIVFDQLIPRIANYWTKSEALSLFDDIPARNINIYRVNNNSWTIIVDK